MTRTQLSFETEDLKRARLRAGQLGISLAEYVRRVVAEDLGEARSTPGADVFFDLGSSAGSDVAADKDRLVAEAFGALGR